MSSSAPNTAAFFTAGASLLQPVFTASRTRSQVELAEVQRDEALLAYQQTILQSVHDVSDALNTYQRAANIERNADAAALPFRGRCRTCESHGIDWSIFSLPCETNALCASP